MPPPARSLHVDFNTAHAFVRSYVECKKGRQSDHAVNIQTIVPLKVFHCFFETFIERLRVIRLCTTQITGYPEPFT
jgi:hypothetical protein